MSVSKKLMEEFKNHVHKENITMNGVDLCLRILNSGFWPTLSSIPNCTIPIAPQQAFDTFKYFYLRKHSCRKLTLLPWGEFVGDHLLSTY
jgi:cullin 3